MKRLLPLLVLMLIPFPAVAHADGCPPSQCGTTSSAPPGSSIVFVRPSGQPGPLQAFDVRNGKKRFGLPYGVLSGDGTFVAAKTARRSRFLRYDALTGKRLGGWSLPGRWQIAAISADGRFSAIVHYWRRGIALRVGGWRGALRGSYQVEALSPNGQKIFLIHWKRTGAYDLRQLDIVTGKLSPTRLDEPDEKMSGQAMGAVATRDGRWLYTLYIKPDGGTFVHALDLSSGLAHCIDLPLRGDLATVGATALALSPGEQRLYLTSPLLGRVTTLDLRRLEVESTTRFKPAQARGFLFGIGPSAALSPNGRMLAFVTVGRLWLVDTAYGIVRGPTRVPGGVIGVGFLPDGARVATITEHGHYVFDAATGRRL